MVLGREQELLGLLGLALLGGSSLREQLEGRGVSTDMKDPAIFPPCLRQQQRTAEPGDQSPQSSCPQSAHAESHRVLPILLRVRVLILALALSILPPRTGAVLAALALPLCSQSCSEEAMKSLQPQGWAAGCSCGLSGLVLQGLVGCGPRGLL